MGFYPDQILPRATDAIMAREQLDPIRAHVAAGLDGEALEAGFGSGLNIACYPPAVRRVWAVDPATAGAQTGGRGSPPLPRRSSSPASTGRTCRWTPEAQITC